VFKKTDKMRWEHWAIPIVVTRGVPQSGDDTRLERSLQQSVLKILEHAQHIDHVPPVMYEFEVRVARRCCRRSASAVAFGPAHAFGRRTVLTVLPVADRRSCPETRLLARSTSRC
jgi:hypothetical protein